MPVQSMGKCTVCEQDVFFKTDANGGFACDGGVGNHKLPLKKYYELNCGHIQSVRDRRKYAPQVILKARMPIPGIGPNNTVQQGAGITVQFQGSGLFETEDAELQYYLDRYPYVSKGEEGLKRWRELFLTPEQQNNVAKSELEDTQRQIKEQNSLLEQLKSQGTKKAQAVA